jgi:hypothetical protein
LESKVVFRIILRLENAIEHESRSCERLP